MASALPSSLDESPQARRKVHAIHQGKSRRPDSKRQPSVEARQAFETEKHGHSTPHRRGRPPASATICGSAPEKISDVVTEVYTFLPGGIVRPPTNIRSATRRSPRPPTAYGNAPRKHPPTPSRNRLPGAQRPSSGAWNRWRETRSAGSASSLPPSYIRRRRNTDAQAFRNLLDHDVAIVLSSIAPPSRRQQPRHGAETEGHAGVARRIRRTEYADLTRS